MPNTWINALQQWNEGKQKWSIPKKGSKGYNEVRKLMGNDVEINIAIDGKKKLGKEDKKIIKKLGKIGKVNHKFS
jgi:hypothetical protein